MNVQWRLQFYIFLKKGRCECGLFITIVLLDSVNWTITNEEQTKLLIKLFENEISVK